MTILINILTMRNYQVDYKFYDFVAEDERGDYFKGNHRLGNINCDGYVINNYMCDDGNWHSMGEHIAKWEYFNGKIPEGMQIDHIIPVSMGGTNKMSNLRLLTRKENHNNTLTRKNMSEARKGNTFALGNVMSEESKCKISKSMKGKFINRPDQSKQVYQYNSSNELIAVYFSRNEAARQTGFDKRNIGAACNGRLKTYKGYKWSYEPL